MVVAYGTAKKESFTGSASVINNKKLELRPISNVTKGLEGQTTGLLTTSGSGQPGEAAKIVIRGYGSINASQDPLYVVDGIPFSGDMSSINPADACLPAVSQLYPLSKIYPLRKPSYVNCTNSFWSTMS